MNNETLTANNQLNHYGLKVCKVVALIYLPQTCLSAGRLHKLALINLWKFVQFVVIIFLEAKAKCTKVHSFKLYLRPINPDW